MNYKEDEVILCKVKKIEGTTVFLETDSGFPASMVLSEVAAGRIRNIRQYVAPNKVIACKIMKVKSDHLELSLRRVTGKERDQVVEENKRERAFANMLKTIGEKPELIIEEIRRELNISEFLDEAKEDKKLIEKYLSKEKAEKLFTIISEKEEREKVVDKKIMLKSYSSNGLSEIKSILDVKEASNIHYLGSSMFSVSASGKDFKEANANLTQLIDGIVKRAKEHKVLIEVKEK